MNIHYLGTCSGTEPMPNMHHASLIMEINGKYYWFDAGECCVHTACSLGLNVMRSRAVFISHPHIDHIGGLANLFACIGKLIRRYDKRLITDNTLDIFFPNPELLQAIKLVSNSGFGTDLSFTLKEHKTCEGLLFCDENIRVTALSNTHLQQTGIQEPLAFSFLIEAEGKRIVFSGDVGTPEELDPFTKEGCALLIMETGHHKVADVCRYALERGIPQLRLTHHGREIINDRPGVEDRIRHWVAEKPICVRLCHDGMTEAL